MTPISAGGEFLPQAELQDLPVRWTESGERYNNFRLLLPPDQLFVGPRLGVALGVRCPFHEPASP